MLLYIHTQTTTYIYRTSKTNKPNSKFLQPGTSASSTPHKALRGDVSNVPTTEFLCTGF